MGSSELRLAVIGDPIAHSLSPAMHAAALAAAGLRGTYEAIRVPTERLPAAVAELRQRGYDGFNVTIPHKAAMVALVDERHDLVAAVRALNTVVIDTGRLIGYNTDVTGFARIVDAVRPRWVGRETAVVLGAGGSARAVVAVLRERCHCVVVANRHVERANHVFAGIAGVSIVPLRAESVAPHLAEASMLVNATAAGMNAPDETPLPMGPQLNGGLIVCDLVYQPRVTRLLRDARSAGCRTIDGLDLLVAQGADAFRLWTGVHPDESAMRAAVEEAQVVQTPAAALRSGGEVR